MKYTYISSYCPVFHAKYEYEYFIKQHTETFFTDQNTQITLHMCSHYKFKFTASIPISKFSNHIEWELISYLKSLTAKTDVRRFQRF